MFVLLCNLCFIQQISLVLVFIFTVGVKIAEDTKTMRRALHTFST